MATSHRWAGCWSRPASGTALQYRCGRPQSRRAPIAQSSARSRKSRVLPCRPPVQRSRTISSAPANARRECPRPRWHRGSRPVRDAARADRRGAARLRSASDASARRRTIRVRCGARGRAVTAASRAKRSRRCRPLRQGRLPAARSTPCHLRPDTTRKRRSHGRRAGEARRDGAGRARLRQPRGMSGAAAKSPARVSGRRVRGAGRAECRRVHWFVDELDRRVKQPDCLLGTLEAMNSVLPRDPRMSCDDRGVNDGPRRDVAVCNLAQVPVGIVGSQRLGEAARTEMETGPPRGRAAARKARRGPARAKIARSPVAPAVRTNMPAAIAPRRARRTDRRVSASVSA